MCAGGPDSIPGADMLGSGKTNNITYKTAIIFVTANIYGGMIIFLLKI